MDRFIFTLKLEGINSGVPDELRKNLLRIGDTITESNGFVLLTVLATNNVQAVIKEAVENAVKDIKDVSKEINPVFVAGSMSIDWSYSYVKSNHPNKRTSNHESHNSQEDL